MRERASESSEPGQTKRRTAARRPRAQAAEPPLVVATALDPLDPSVEPRRRGGRRKRGIPAAPSAQLRDACVRLCLTNGWSPSGAEVERLVRLRAEVAGGRRNDTALDHRRLSFARWLVEHGRLSETSD
jgi:hypothetical protein